MALLTALSGAAAPYGLADKAGFEFWIEDTNAAGGLKVGGDTYKLKGKVYDHRYITADTVSSAKKAVGWGARFICSMGGGVTPSIQGYLQKEKILLLAETFGSKKLTSTKWPLTFSNYPSTMALTRMALPYLIEQWGSDLKIAYAALNDPAGRANVEEFQEVTKQLGLPIEWVIDYIEADTLDFTPVLLKFQKAGANTLCTPIRAAHIPLILKQAYEMGYQLHSFALIAGVDLQTLIKTAGKGAEGFIGFRMFPKGKAATPKMAELIERYIESHGGETPASGDLWEVYGAFQFLAAAISKAGTIKDPYKIAAIMREQEVETVSGPTLVVGEELPGFGISSQISYPIPIVKIINGKAVLKGTRLYRGNK
jgi:branched-chain amino acid transport system substrate-binding protein